MSILSISNIIAIQKIYFLGESMEDIRRYRGYETGPIRPPSEAYSLLLRVTRNCPWNKCRFCNIYRGRKFSIRRPEHVIRDIEEIRLCVDAIRRAEKMGDIQAEKLRISAALGQGWERTFLAAARWYRSGMESVFLQDASSMIIKTGDMVEILRALRRIFPEIKRVTTYSRSDALVRKSDGELKSIKEAGLDRIHIGMETGSDKVLELVRKGADKATHVIAGQKAKKAGFELSEHYMPGLGGIGYMEENALETADAFSKIAPDFIRIRSLAVLENSELYGDYRQGVFTRANDVRTAEEILLMTGRLEGITSTVLSDHIVNLLPEVEGKLPQDRQKMSGAINWFLSLSEEDSILFRIGRRTNAIKCIADFYDPVRRARAGRYIEEKGIDASNVDNVIDSLMNRFI